MTLQVVGAGLGRTGTTSLKAALEQLLGGRCFHMTEVFGHQDIAQAWIDAVAGDYPDWEVFFADYRATVDWPAAAFWREISDAFPDALVLLSTRDADAWWKSARNTIFQAVSRDVPPDSPIATERQMILDVFHGRFTLNWDDADAAKAAYLRHNNDVRSTIPAERLLEWHPGDGWGPLCAALHLPEPDAPFPHTNTTDEFRLMAGLDEAG